MRSDPASVRYLARLARLALHDDQVAAVETELERMLDMVEVLQQTDVGTIAPMAHPFDATLALREDAVTEPDRHAALAALAPETQGGFYLVPKVLE